MYGVRMASIVVGYGLFFLALYIASEYGAARMGG